MFANLEGANLIDTDLKRAKLKRANLEWAKLKRTDLKWAKLSGAHLEGAFLYGAKLSGAYLIDADLEGAYIDNTKLLGTNCYLARVNSQTVITDCEINEETDFTNVGLSGSRIDPKLHTQLLRNIRKMQWEKWYAEKKILISLKGHGFIKWMYDVSKEPLFLRSTSCMLWRVHPHLYS